MLLVILKKELKENNKFYKCFIFIIENWTNLSEISRVEKKI